MAVKKTVDGIFLFFGHNTESFVSAPLDPQPKHHGINQAIGYCFDEQ